MILSGESSKATGEANLIKDCLIQMRFDKSLNNDLNTKIPSVLSTQQKATRNRFIILLGCSMNSTRVKSK